MKGTKILSVLGLMIAISLSGCTTDRDIKADIATKAKSDVNFANVVYRVDQGKVTLSGNCVSTASKQYVENKIKGIKVVKSISNYILVAPVALKNDPILKQSVDSVLATYPYVQAQITGYDITLIGQADKKQMERLLPAIKKLNPSKLDNQIVVL